MQTMRGGTKDDGEVAFNGLAKGSRSGAAGANETLGAPSVSSDVSTDLIAALRAGIAADGGWWPFDRYMHAALYTPGLGYYASGRTILGASPASGSDFVTAPEMSPAFGRCVAAQVAQLLDACVDRGGDACVDRESAACGSGDVWEFGAGSGALAEQILDALGDRITRYTIIDVSAAMQARQRERLARFGDRVRWALELPRVFERGVVLGNEVLDAMPVKRVAFDGDAWFERGVAVDAAGGLVDADRPTTLRPPNVECFGEGCVTEVHLQARAFVATIAERLHDAAALFIDYGFPEAEYYHPQRAGGTLMAHRTHEAMHDDRDLLADPGTRDITSHLDFTALALAAQEAGADVLGYTSQGRFLLNCGLIAMLDGADPRAKNAAHRLIAEHEMGELFKVLLFARGVEVDAIGFSEGDRSHRL